MEKVQINTIEITKPRELSQTQLDWGAEISFSLKIFKLTSVVKPNNLFKASQSLQLPKPKNCIVRWVDIGSISYN